MILWNDKLLKDRWDLVKNNIKALVVYIEKKWNKLGDGERTNE